MHIHLFHLDTKARNWYAQAYVGGKRYRFTCNTTDKRTARKYAEQRLNELEARHNRGLVGLPDPVRFSEVLDRYERTELPKLRPASQGGQRGSLHRRERGSLAAPSRTLSSPVSNPMTCSPSSTQNGPRE